MSNQTKEISNIAGFTIVKVNNQYRVTESVTINGRKERLVGQGVTPELAFASFLVELEESGLTIMSLRVQQQNDAVIAQELAIAQQVAEQEAKLAKAAARKAKAEAKKAGLTLKEAPKSFKPSIVTQVVAPLVITVVPNKAVTKAVKAPRKPQGFAPVIRYNDRVVTNNYRCEVTGVEQRWTPRPVLRRDRVEVLVSPKVKRPVLAK